jgi:hypothetical protein
MEPKLTESNAGVGKRFASIVMSLGLAFMIPMAAAAEPAVKCSKGPWDFRDPASLKLTDGEHSLGKVETPEGALEVRVKVQKGEVSDPMYFLRGKQLKKVSDAKVPKELRECMNLKKTATLHDWIGQPMIATLDWLITSAEARACVARVISVTCNQNTCCALASCGRAREVWCEGF